MSSPAERPWWREPMVCLVIAGPAIVVVASFVTLGLVIRYPDPPLDRSPVAAHDTAGQPAMQGRNHVATAGTPGRRP